MSDREKAGFRGPVKKVNEEAVQPGSPEKGTPDRRQTTVLEFDGEGRTMTVRGSAAGMEWTSVNAYDENGRLLKSSSSSAGSPYHETSYSYDNGRLTQYISSGTQGRIEASCSYDEQGRRTVVHVFDAVALEATRAGNYSGSPWPAMASGHGVPDGGRVRMRFDEREQPIEAEILGIDGKAVQRITRGYDQEGRLVEEKQIVENPEYMVPGGVRAQMLLQTGASLDSLREQLGKFFGGTDGLTRILYRYDAQGRVGETRTLRAPFYEQVKIMLYNDHGDLAEERSTTSGTYGAKLDENGNVVPSVSPVPEPEQSAIRFSYKYDDRGNWTEQTATHVGPNGQPKPGMIRKREIIYH